MGDETMPILHWLTRDEDLKTAARVPYRLLEEVPELGYGDPGTENMLIQGDNLEALKALLPLYAGKVKCIFIDPPYNTRSASITDYDDNREHAQWLALMYPRLELLRELLREDGSIWVTIDDNEGHYLKVLMDEVFGRDNFLTTFIWKKSYGGGAKARWFVGLHEYMHCYAANMKALPDMYLPPLEASSKYYKLKDEKFTSRGPYRLQPLATTSNEYRPNLRYPIPLAEGGEVWPKKQWQWSSERVRAAMQDNEIVFKSRRGIVSVSYKQYLRSITGEERRTKPVSIIDGHFTQHGTYESVNHFGLEAKFSFPKPEGLLRQVLEAASGVGDLILDSFLGSGTTAAVAQKMNRRYIGIELGEHAATHCVPRLKKVIEGEQGGISKAVNWQGGGGFRFYRLGKPVFDASGKLNHGIRFEHLAAHLWFMETRRALGKPKRSPLLGVHRHTAYFLLYNGVLGERRPQGGNVLTRKVLEDLEALLAQHPEREAVRSRVVYGESARLLPGTLRSLGIVFKQTPYDVRSR